MHYNWVELSITCLALIEEIGAALEEGWNDCDETFEVNPMTPFGFGPMSPFSLGRVTGMNCLCFRIIVICSNRKRTGTQNSQRA